MQLAHADEDLLRAASTITDTRALDEERRAVLDAYTDMERKFARVMAAIREYGEVTERLHAESDVDIVARLYAEAEEHEKQREVLYKQREEYLRAHDQCALECVRLRAELQAVQEWRLRGTLDYQRDAAERVIALSCDKEEALHMCEIRQRERDDAIQERDRERERARDARREAVRLRGAMQQAEERRARDSKAAAVRDEVQMLIGDGNSNNAAVKGLSGRGRGQGTAMAMNSKDSDDEEEDVMVIESEPVLPTQDYGLGDNKVLSDALRKLRDDMEQARSLLKEQDEYITKLQKDIEALEAEKHKTTITKSGDQEIEDIYTKQLLTAAQAEVQSLQKQLRGKNSLIDTLKMQNEHDQRRQVATRETLEAEIDRLKDLALKNGSDREQVLKVITAGTCNCREEIEVMMRERDAALEALHQQLSEAEQAKNTAMQRAKAVERELEKVRQHSEDRERRHVDLRRKYELEREENRTRERELLQRADEAVKSTSDSKNGDSTQNAEATEEKDASGDAAAPTDASTRTGSAVSDEEVNKLKQCILELRDLLRAREQRVKALEAAVKDMKQRVKAVIGGAAASEPTAQVELERLRAVVKELTNGYVQMLSSCRELWGFLSSNCIYNLSNLDSAHCIPDLSPISMFVSHLLLIYPLSPSHSADPASVVPSADSTEKIAALEQSVTTLNNTVKAQKVKLDKLRAALDKERQEHSENSSLASEKEKQLSSECEKLRKERERAQALYTKERDRAQKLEQRLSQSKQGNNSGSTTQLNTSASNDGKSSDGKGGSSPIDAEERKERREAESAMSRELAHLRRTQATLKQRYAELKDRYAKLLTEHAQTKSELSAATISLHTQAKQKAPRAPPVDPTTVISLEQQRRSVFALQEEVSALKRAINVDCKHAIQTLHDTNVRLRTRVVELEREISLCSQCPLHRAEPTGAADGEGAKQGLAVNQQGDCACICILRDLLRAERERGDGLETAVMTEKEKSLEYEYRLSSQNEDTKRLLNRIDELDEAVNAYQAKLSNSDPNSSNGSSNGSNTGAEVAERLQRVVAELAEVRRERDGMRAAQQKVEQYIRELATLEARLEGALEAEKRAREDKEKEREERKKVMKQLQDLRAERDRERDKEMEVVANASLVESELRREIEREKALREKNEVEVKMLNKRVMETEEKYKNAEDKAKVKEREVEELKREISLFDTNVLDQVIEVKNRYEQTLLALHKAQELLKKYNLIV